MLIELAHVFDTSVGELLGEISAPADQLDSLEVIASKLELINLQLAGRAERTRKAVRGICVAALVLIVLGYLGFFVWGSEYLTWDYQDPETAVLATGIHSVEWVFARVAPLGLLLAALGVFVTRKKY